jgi:TrmH family RNA methyltransferase
MAKIEQITSPSNPKIKAAAALHLRKYRKETGLFMVEGLRAVAHAVSRNIKPRQLIFSSKMEMTPDLQRLIESSESALSVSKPILEKLSGKDNPQSVIGVFRQNLQTLDAISPASKCWVALEEVRDPGNLGTIMRTVDAVGADGVLLVGLCCDPYAPESVRATMDSVFNVSLAACKKEEFIEFASQWPGRVVATALNEDTVDFREADYIAPLLLVMGSEQNGISPEIQKAAHRTVKLPMNGQAESLNLAVATGIMLYAALEPWK